MNEPLTLEEKQTLLEVARRSMESAVNGKKPPALDAFSLTSTLRADGASFVTLTKRGDLRGCIGALEPYQPLAADVRDHAVAAALEDYRFPPVEPSELTEIEVEVSRLTVPTPLEYGNTDDLLARLRPGVDGVILKDGFHRATFLPQVWAQLPEKAAFLAHLCSKMGAAPDLWKRKHLEVMIYTVEEFHE